MDVTTSQFGMAYAFFSISGCKHKGCSFGSQSWIVVPEGREVNYQKSNLATQGLFSKLKVQSLRTHISKSELGISRDDTQKKHQLSKQKDLFSKLKVESLRTHISKSELGISRDDTHKKHQLSKQKDSKNSNSLGRRLSFEKTRTASLSERKFKETKISDQSDFRSVFSEDYFNIKDSKNSNSLGRRLSFEKTRTASLSKRKFKDTKRSDQSDFRSVFSEDFFNIKSFKDLGASDLMIQALSSMQVKRPSQIQAMAYQPIFEGQSCIVAEQTGSGKTLAYLVPLVQRLNEEERRGLSKSLSNRPRILIVVPTSELAAQVLKVCRSLSKAGIPLKSTVATGSFKLKTQLDNLEDGPNILIATPGRLIQLLDLKGLLLDKTLSVVIDEVDILFDDNEFSDALKKVEESVSVKAQYVHVTATLPVDVHRRLLEKHPEIIPLMGPGLHCTATGLHEVLVDCSGDGEEKTPEKAFENKKAALIQLVDMYSVSKTIIFCNKIETCRQVENVLKRIDRKGNNLCALPYHAALTQEARLDNMQQFLECQPEKQLFLICTDRASRGLDLVAVDHVLLFDFPRDPSEYIRRVGRTARAGSGGKAFIFVVGKQVALARRIMVRNEKGHPLHRVPVS